MVARLFERGNVSGKAVSLIVSFLLSFSLLSFSVVPSSEAFADEDASGQVSEGTVSDGAVVLSAGDAASISEGVTD